MNTAVETIKLTKRYGSKIVIDNLDLNIEEGKVTGLLGPNGAGKSTLLKALVGLVRPDSGSISIFGQKPSIKLNSEIAYLPDRAGWYQFHTVKTALEYAKSVFPGFDEPKSEEMVKQMKLDIDMKVETLSKGQQACLQLILCLARNVRLCILDEPFSGIDLISRERIIQGIIESIMDGSRTLIISTHEIYESESLFEKVVFLEEGHVKLAGEVEELRRQGDSLENVYRRLYR
ncbi:MAG: ABC transporter ATP-binding protein [Bacillota bacterium]|nr:ABC transporter ATP-binding protein [Bacillota bacterium]